MPGTAAPPRRESGRQEIKCHDCRRRFPAARPNAKYCGVCRIVRDLTALGDNDHDRKCRVCEARFYRTSRGQQHCFTCTPWLFRNRWTRDAATCRFCDKAGPVLHEELEVCLGCVTAGDRALHQRVLDAVIRKQVRRRATMA